MSRSWVRRAEPWTIAATPPTTMNSTPAPLRAGRSCSRSTMESPPPRLPHLLCEALQSHQVAQPFLDRQLQVLPKQSPIYVLLICLDDRIALDEEPRFVHGSTLPLLSKAHSSLREQPEEILPRPLPDLLGRLPCLLGKPRS